MLSRYIFAGLVLVHGAGVLFAPVQLAPLFAGSVYLPLLLLQSIGLPVFAAGKSGGWAGPSPLGWWALVVLWSITWWGVAKLAACAVARAHSRRVQPYG